MPKQYIPLWHPDVHDFMGEQLYFYSMQIEQDYASRVGRILNVLRDTFHLEGVSCYSVLGRDDLLLRTWLPEQRSTEMTEGVANATGDDVRFTSMSVKVIDHWAFGDPIGESIVSRYSIDQILAVQDAVLVSESEEDHKAQSQNLVDDDLLHVMETGPGRGTRPVIKFYMALRRSSPANPQLFLDVYAKLKSQVFPKYSMRRGRRHTIGKVSAYLGDGSLANILLKGEANSVDAIVRFSVDVSKQSEPAGMRPESMVVANITDLGLTQRDNVSRTHAYRSAYSYTPLVQRWAPELYDGLEEDLVDPEALAEAERLALEFGLFRGWSEDDRSMLRSLLDMAVRGAKDRHYESIPQVVSAVQTWALSTEKEFLTRLPDLAYQCARLRIAIEQEAQLDEPEVMKQAGGLAAKWRDETGIVRQIREWAEVRPTVSIGDYAWKAWQLISLFNDGLDFLEFLDEAAIDQLGNKDYWDSLTAERNRVSHAVLWNLGISKDPPDGTPPEFQLIRQIADFSRSTRVLIDVAEILHKAATGDTESMARLGELVKGYASHDTVWKVQSFERIPS